ncbi:hypothetical protein THRCLA_11514, partial [Thraustotheca clavata]
MKWLLIHAIAAWQSTLALDRLFYGLDYDTRTSDSGGCKSVDAIRDDFAVMGTVTQNVRIYTMEEPCVENVLEVAAEYNMRIWLGIWGDIDSNRDGFEQGFQVFQRLVQNNKIRNDNVLGIGVAANSIYRYYIQGHHDFANTTGTDKLITYAARTREFVRANGLNFPVT